MIFKGLVYQEIRYRYLIFMALTNKATNLILSRSIYLLHTHQLNQPHGYFYRDQLVMFHLSIRQRLVQIYCNEEHFREYCIYMLKKNL